jgi:S1-C subfamily serine protease
VVTNAHVVDDCETILVAGRADATLVARDPNNDLALIKSPSSIGMAGIRFRLDGARLGEEVVAAGFPLRGILADSLNVTPGVVSSLVGLENDSRFLQTTAAIQPGNSGGPLVDREGRLVGVVTSKLDAAITWEKGGFIPEGVNFAIRQETLRPFLESHRISIVLDSGRPDVLSIEEVAEIARRSVVSIQCVNGAIRSAEHPQPR